MKIKITSILLLTLLILGMTACQRDQSDVESPPPQATSTEIPTEVESGYPAPETAPTKAASQPAGKSAYPVTQEDLQLLFHTWSLTNTLVDQVSQEAGRKTIKFNPDATFEMTTDEGSQTGQWRTRLTAVQSTLILESEAGVTTYEILVLTESALNLRSTQDNMQIEEQYLPAD